MNTVREFEGRDGPASFWTKIGSAWWNKDGEGISLQLDALPVDGRLVLRPPFEDDDQDDGRN